jgi:hypothetical protein
LLQWIWRSATIEIRDVRGARSWFQADLIWTAPPASLALVEIDPCAEALLTPERRDCFAAVSV